MEFPLNKAKEGWKEGRPGGARIIMSEETTKDGKHDVFHGVVGHDETRGDASDASVHYAATHYPAKKKA